jgi:hypothetical protein
MVGSNGEVNWATSVVDQVENKSLRIITIIMMITMNIDYIMTLNCIYNPNNNNEIHIP